MQPLYRYLWLLFLLTGYWSTAQAQTQVLTPYLQGPEPTALWITWKTSSNPDSRVDYGLSATSLTTQVLGSEKTLSDTGYPANYFYHSVHLTGLTPDTKYYYRISTGTTVSQVYSFHTLPAKGQALSDGHIRLLIMGDNQLKATTRWDDLMLAAKRKMIEKYGPDFQDKVNMITTCGDQVDVGTLDHYENVHFGKSKYLSPVMPLNTVVGNHETYGTLGLTAYRDHFFYDQYTYQGISSGTEDYYAFQVGRVLVMMLCTENIATIGTAQRTWVNNVIDAAKTDNSVDFIIAQCHRPLQAEQYVGDISTFVRDNVVPKMVETDKAVMIVGAHHHLYARGQHREKPFYNIISGGSAWDQYWGMSVEQDFDDVQKTLPQWAYQLVDFDTNTREMTVESYSIGSIYKRKNNQLIDTFHRKLGQPAPATPALVSVPTANVTLPLTLQSSAYSSPVNEPANSTQFQVSKLVNFSNLEVDKLRDVENFFGANGSPDSTRDLNRGVDIFRYVLPPNSLPNGTYYARLRHRDQNAMWSTWSATASFTVINSVANVRPVISVAQKTFGTTAPIPVTYVSAPGGPRDWIGIYRKGVTPGGSTATTTWQYTSGSSGAVTLGPISTVGEYFVAFFSNDGYTEIADRVSIFVGPKPVLQSNKLAYTVGEAVSIAYSNAPALTKDWVGIYKVGNTPGTGAGTSPSTQYQYTAGAAGTRTFTTLPKAYYYATYFLTDQYTEPGERIFFQVGTEISSVAGNKTAYRQQEPITVTFADGPGIPKDYMGIFARGEDPANGNLIGYVYFEGKTRGSVTFPAGQLPTAVGDYFLAMFTNDSYTEVSNRFDFTVVPAVPLPVTLVSFTGAAAPNGNVLKWATASEANSDRFEVEFAADGRSFAKIGEVAAAGSSTTAQAYQYVHSAGFGEVAYYRLKQVDKNGTFAYSQVISIVAKGVTTQLFPNPVRDHVTVRLQAVPTNTAVAVQVMDMKGAVILATEAVTEGQLIRLDVAKLVPGKYTLHLVFPHSSVEPQNLPFVKQ